MAGEVRDIVVVGAGIHGAGVAQAAAAKGHDVLVLEKKEPAAGTSSRSSKLVHGGLRYLESAQFSLVRESLRERNLLLRIAPDLVRRVTFHIPVYRDTSRGPWKVRLGLILYRILQGLRTDDDFGTVPREEWDRLDGLRTEGLLQVFRYSDAQTDDAALTRAVLRSAVDLGAEIACPARMEEAVRDGVGFRVRYVSEGRGHEVRCRVLVNAAGPWANEIVRRIRPLPSGLQVDLVQGTHILVEGCQQRGVYYTESPEDHRAVLMIPWGGETLVGTTETPVRGDPDHATPLDGEIDYLLRVFRSYFPGRSDRVTGSFAGIRVLPKGWGLAFHRSREVVLWVDDHRRPRLLTVYGGKLTTYRSTASKILRKIRRSLPARSPKADTAELALTDTVS